jgi:AraC-like DNA-binding protein
VTESSSNRPLRNETDLIELALFGSKIVDLRAKLCYDKRLERLWNAFESSYSDHEFDLGKSCQECGMSKTNLNSLLKRLSGGHTCYELLTAYRIYRSVLAALATNDSFSEIAAACGFDSVANYSRTFNRLLGAAPSTVLTRGKDYRRRVQPSASWIKMFRVYEGHK